MKQDHHNLIENDAFDHFLMKQLQQSQPYVADDNFTLQVMDKLPAPKKLSLWQERLIMLIPLLIISLLVLSQFSVLAILVKVWTFLVGMNVTHLLQIGLLTSIAAVGGASFWFAKQFKLI